MTEEGATVAIVDIDKAAGETVAAGLPGSSFHPCDVISEAEVRATFEAVVAQHGRLDVLVNNAGIEGVNWPTHELELAEWSG
jgi:NAD(P)-dependent dehydrogenase (short-subunit alcohol dehydrogenase family)